MIFNLGNHETDTESYKERNLYYKYLAGYYFNELIDGWQERTLQFYKKLNDAEFKFGPTLEPFKLDELTNLTQSTVTFDNHLTQVMSRADAGDAGEFADILVRSADKQSLVAIEAKYLSNWTVDKDIIQNQRRIAEYQKYLTKNSTSINEPIIRQVLLIPAQKWDRSREKNKIQSEELSVPLTVLLWEDFLKPNESDAMTPPQAREMANAYLTGMLKRRYDKLQST